MAHDLLIRNGLVVDGTGAPARRADVAVSGGVITEIGAPSPSARRSIDASDLVVAPGFVDHHTHYDAQICWDSTTSCSPWHGVTSVIMGNCGVGLAPCRPGEREVVAWDLVNVEGIPFEVLSAGVTWDWESFPDFMAAAARRRSGVNLGFLAPLTPFRHYVLGEASSERAATPGETQQIAALLREAIAAGALGWSTSFGPQHVGYRGRPLACRLASREELVAYGRVLRELGRGAIELNLSDQPGVVSDLDYERIELLLDASGRPLTWLSLLHRDQQPSLCRETLARTAPLIARGARPQISARPLVARIELRNPFAFANLPEWKPAFNCAPAEQMQLYRRPEFRRAFRDSLDRGYFLPREVYFRRLEVASVAAPALRSCVGRSIDAIARERGVDAVDAFLDVALEDGLETAFTIDSFNTDPDGVAELLRHPSTLIGLSDGGAHVDMLCDAGYPSYVLGTWVRERKSLSLERAVARMSSEPADFFGLADRGRIEVGKAADFAIFDPATVGSDKVPVMRRDLPAGGRRMVMPARGIHFTVVNGEVLFENQEHSGALPGFVLRGAPTARSAHR
jgi:N-acyl-D-aspartate/D-glutamate deacylase